MRSLFVPISIASLLLAGGVGAEPAMVARTDGGVAQAKSSFDGFARQWIAKALARSEREGEAPRARSGAAGMTFTYQAVAEDFDTELRPTGRPSAPWVGVLHYTEHTYTCADALGKECHITSSLPMTEVFRFRDGSWGY